MCTTRPPPYRPPGKLSPYGLPPGSAEIEPFLNQPVNMVTVAQAASLFVAARVGLVLLRWIGRLIVFAFYVAASSLLRLRWVVRCCAYVLVRWQVDVGRAILNLHPDHLAVRANVGGVQGTSDASAHLKVESSARQFGPGWDTDLRTDRYDQDNQWAAWAQRRDRLDHYDQLLAQELRRGYRFPPDT